MLNLIPQCAKNLPKRSWISITLKFTDTGTWTCWFRRSIYWSIPKQNYQSRKGTWNRYIQRVLQREECSWFDYSKWRKSFNNTALAQKPVMKCKILLIYVFKLFWISAWYNSLPRNDSTFLESVQTPWFESYNKDNWQNGSRGTCN